KNKTHPINVLPMKFFDTTIFDFIEASFASAINATDVYGEKAFELTKEYSQRAVEFYIINRVKAVELYKAYSAVTIEKSLELYETATKLYDTYSVQLTELVKNVS
ncbi:hypothetical protein, partial [Salmonella sp. s55044]|uniref:hypothetical protein n=1 Tax=Salmonella sp. s55044 TaxID=3159677 RepID=UPI003980DA0F